MMPDTQMGEWLAMVHRFDELGRATEEALDTNMAQVAQLLEERDALLAQLSAALAVPPTAQVTAPVTEALTRSATDTATLITQVAERTDALRRALRELDRGARATQAYQLTSGSYPQVDARR
jgi:ABC-type transporter Mla subunit MlaD